MQIIPPTDGGFVICVHLKGSADYQPEKSAPDGVLFPLRQKKKK
jgi:hypothetical protein